MGDFVANTQKLTAQLKHVLAADSAGEFHLRLGDLRPALADWKDGFRLLVDPSQETLDAVLDYTSMLTEVVMREAGLKIAPAAGGRRYTRRYCKTTPCRRMGFTQKASCRPYKNCYRSTRS